MLVKAWKSRLFYLYHRELQSVRLDQAVDSKETAEVELPLMEQPCWFGIWQDRLETEAKLRSLGLYI